MDLSTSQHKRQISDDSGTVAKRKKYAEPESRPNGLAYLPEEVLLLILEVLSDSLVRCNALGDVLQHVKTLHNLCLTNRKFNRLATPYLCTFVNNRNRRKVPQALDAMILDSQKAASIKYMSWALDVKRSPQAICRRSPKAETVFLKQLGRLGIPELAGDLRYCFHGNAPEYHLATALVLAPNLEYLEAADVNYEQETLDDTIWRPVWLELLTMKALSSPPGLAQHFRHLHHLRLGMGELRFEQIGSLLRLPALRTLHLVGGQHNGRISTHPWDEEVAKRCSTVETLIFEYCSVSSEIVAQVLDAIGHLKVLKLELNSWSSGGVEDEHDSDAPQLSWSTLSTAIAEHKGSLERLYIIEGETISWSTTETGRGLNATEQDCIGSLRDMYKLCYLDTGLRPFQTSSTSQLFGSASFHESLPSSLEHLVIKVEEDLDQFEEHFQRNLRDLAADCKSRLPSLQDVVVWLPKSGKELHALDFSACKAVFESQDVGFIVMVYHQKSWQLHQSTITEPSPLGSGSWGCQLHNTICDPPSQDGRARVIFHGPCSVYHHPYGWSIIDNLAKGRS